MEPKEIKNSKLLFKIHCEIIKQKDIVNKLSFESGITHKLGFSTENSVINDKITMLRSFIDDLNDINALAEKEFDEIYKEVNTEKLKEGG